MCNSYRRSIRPKRINILLPDTTVKVLNRVTSKGHRSRFISEAVLYYIESRAKASLRERLKQESIENAKRDLELTAAWFPLEEEAAKLGTRVRRRPVKRKRP